MSIYGIELLDDNVTECRDNLLHTFAEYLCIDASDPIYAAAIAVLALNVVHGDALSIHPGRRNERRSPSPSSLILVRASTTVAIFRFDTMTRMSSYDDEGTLFADLGKHEIFTPTTDFGTLSVVDLAGGAPVSA